MKNWTFRRDHVLGLILLLLFGAGFADASGPAVSGTYEVIGKTQVGPRIKVQFRLHLTNHGPGLLRVQKVLLWDFAHPPVAGAAHLSIVVGAGNTEETTQEFVVPRLQFYQWQRGVRPRVVLELQTATEARVRQAIRLDRVPGRVPAQAGGRTGE